MRLIILLLGMILMSCGSEDVCMTCVLAQTSVEVCDSNYEELAARNNLDVASREEYITALQGTGFTCQ